MHKYIGARMARKEDDRFLHGRGQYIGDLRFAGMRDVAFVRSPVAHARIVNIHIPDHLREFGVHRQGPCRRQADPGGVAAAGVPGLRAAGACHRQGASGRRTGRGMRRRYPGRGRGHRRAGAVEYDELPAVVDMLAAQEPGAPRSTTPSRATSFLARRLRRRRREAAKTAPVKVTARSAHRAPSDVADRVPRLRRAMGQPAQPTRPARCDAFPHVVRTGTCRSAAIPQCRSAWSPPISAAASATRRFWRGEEVA